MSPEISPVRGRDLLVALAGRGGRPTPDQVLIVPWEELLDAAAFFDPFLRGAGAPSSWRRRDERRDVAFLRVHRTEQGRLLGEAALIVIEALDPGGLWLGPALLGEGAPRWAAWRERSRRELALAYAAGVGAPRPLLVATLWSPALFDAAGARALARAAVGLDPRAENLLALARARVAAGAVEPALAALGRARSRLGDVDEHPALEERLERCRLLALERRGDLPALLAGVACLLGRQRACPGTDLAQLELALALALGRTAELEDSVRRLAGVPADRFLGSSLSARAREWRAAPAARVDRGAARALAAGDPDLALTQVARLFTGAGA